MTRRMSLSPRARLFTAWLVLVFAALCSWESARNWGDRRLAATLVLAIAFVKARIVGLEFMELRLAPLALRLIFEAWTVIACALLIGLYWLIPAGP